jgi:hypothetical protein
MSEVEAEVAGSVSVDDVLQAIQSKNLARAKAHFQDVMGAKINDALESEKVRMADQVFNNAPEQEEPEAEEPASEESSVEDDVEDIFDEEDNE